MFSLAHGGLMLHTLDVDLVIVEERVHSVRNLDIATALLLKTLLGQKAEVLGCTVRRRWRRVRDLLLRWDRRARRVHTARDGGGRRVLLVGVGHEREVHLLELICAVTVATLGLFNLAGERRGRFSQPTPPTVYRIIHARTTQHRDID